MCTCELYAQDQAFWLNLKLKDAYDPHTLPAQGVRKNCIHRRNMYLFVYTAMNALSVVVYMLVSGCVSMG